MPVIVCPSASVTVTVKGAELAVPAANAFAAGTPLIVIAAGMPLSVIELELATPAAIGNVCVAVSSALPVAFVWSNKVTVKLSVPTGEGGPLTVQPAVQFNPLVPLTLVMAGFPASDAGLMPAESVLSVIFTESACEDTNFGLRLVLELLAPGAGMRRVNVGVTRFPDGVPGGAVGVVTGALFEAPPPPPHAVKARMVANAKNLRM